MALSGRICIQHDHKGLQNRLRGAVEASWVGSIPIHPRQSGRCDSEDDSYSSGRQHAPPGVLGCRCLSGTAEADCKPNDEQCNPGVMTAAAGLAAGAPACNPDSWPFPWPDPLPIGAPEADRERPLPGYSELASVCQSRMLMKAAHYVMAAEEQQRKAKSHHYRANPEWRTG